MAGCIAETMIVSGALLFSGEYEEDLRRKT